MNNLSVVNGSLAAVSAQSGKSIAQTFLSAKCICIVDTSGSMDAKDSKGGKSRYDVACEELKALQGEMPGQIAVLSFSSEVEFCPAGIPRFMGESTNLAKALKFAKQADVKGVTFVLISDGEPDNEESALSIAKEYKNKISVVYVGDERRPSGRDFLTRLAKETGGEAITCDRVAELATGIKYLLATPV